MTKNLVSSKAIAATAPAAPPAGPPEFARADGASLSPAIAALLRGGTLSAEQTAVAFEAIMSGHAHHGEIGALLALLATRTPTSAEILGAARVMRRHVDPVQSTRDPFTLVDTAGTGGAPKTFNVSTAAAIVVAAAGRGRIGVAKHGNRSRTGRGSAEVLRALGVNVDAGRDTQARCLDEVGVCFCFAIHHHPAARHAMPVRLALGFPTIFNLLGPLTNPAGAARQVMGVYERRFMAPIAEALRDLAPPGAGGRAMVVHSRDGLDEISISAPTWAMHVEHGQVREDEIDPEAMGLELAPREDVTARDLDHAAQMIRDVLQGKDRGPARSMTLLNAAAALLVGEVVDSMLQGIAAAADAIDSGAAMNTLAALARVSRESN